MIGLRRGSVSISVPALLCRRFRHSYGFGLRCSLPRARHSYDWIAEGQFSISVPGDSAPRSAGQRTREIQGLQASPLRPRGSPKQRRGHEKQARAGGSEPGPPAEAGPPAETRPLGRRSCGGAPPRPRPTRGHEALTQKARKFNARKFGPNLDSSSKTDLETRGKQKELNRKLRRLGAKRAPGRNRARGHPLQRRTRDHRATSPAAGPRHARGSAAAKT